MLVRGGDLAGAAVSARCRGGVLAEDELPEPLREAHGRATRVAHDDVGVREAPFAERARDEPLGLVEGHITGPSQASCELMRGSGWLL